MLAQVLLSWLLIGLGVYAFIGLGVALHFLAHRMRTIDLAGAHPSWVFRLVVLPGLVALWPLVFRWCWLGRSCARPLQPEHDSRRLLHLRLTHRLAVVVLAATMPLIFVMALRAHALALHSGERTTLAQPLLAREEPLAVDVPLDVPHSFPLPVTFVLRTNAERSAAQIEMDVTQDLARPALAVYWTPTSQQAKENGLASGAVFIGSCWGPQRLLFPLPNASEQPGGTLVFLTLTDGQEIVATLPLKKH